MSQPPHDDVPTTGQPSEGRASHSSLPVGASNLRERPLPDDLSRGWIPEDTRQRPISPLPAPALLKYQSLMPFKFVNSLRHPGELPWVIAAYLLTFGVYIAGFIYLVVNFVSVVTGAAEGATLGATLKQLLLLAIYAPLGIFIVRALAYARIRLTAVRITPTQFPEAYQMVVDAARASGLRRVPDAYVQLGNGQINAFASGHGHRRFIVIYSDLFEIGGKARNPEALRFIIGHEVGHIAAGHVSYFRLIFTSFFMQIPVLGSTLSRAQEYTADNFGYRLAPQGALQTMGVLSAGKYLCNEVNSDELANRAVYEKGFFTWMSNLSLTHPPTTWRAHALRDRSEPGRLIWRPKVNPQYPLSAVPAADPARLWPDPLQATDFMNIYPERADNEHWGIVQTQKKEPATERDRRISDTLFTLWVPPHLRPQMPAENHAQESQSEETSYTSTSAEEGNDDEGRIVK
ncbi:M48 family metallopeptidase [Rothia sp. P6271]|uniref:M48 family metallopeptidase n=1 Tax=unclassified Rothia (in: high G+C Gram-positive bacteria) TaxID=2689056 RepID=UPI003AD6D62A